MIAHTMLAVADCELAKAFYLKALTPLGYQKNMDFGEAVGFNDGNRQVRTSRALRLLEKAEQNCLITRLTQH